MGGSVRGASHVASGMPRQDHFWTGSFDDHRVIAAVMCDGAGGVSHGGAGAALAVRTLRSLIQNDMAVRCDVPSEEKLSAWLEFTRVALERAALIGRLSVDALATTAMIAVSDGWITTTAHIGDGFIGARLAENDVWRSLSAPQHGEYAGTTSFLTDDMVCPVTSTFTGSLKCLCLSTDGLEPVAWSEAAHGPHTPFFSGLAGVINEPAGFDAEASARLRVWLASTELQGRVHDDLTLCIALRSAS